MTVSRLKASVAYDRGDPLTLTLSFQGEGTLGDEEKT
jgi:hypothetical protein